MSAATPTADQLIEQWTPMMRGLAYRTGTDLDDILQEAWLLAASMPRKSGGDFMARWLAAVRCHAAAQRPGVTVRPSDRPLCEEYIGAGWLLGGEDGLDDPLKAAVAAESVAAAIGGDGDDDDDTVKWWRIRQEIELPRTAAEIAAARGVSARQGRRDAAALRELEAMQRGLFE